MVSPPLSPNGLAEPIKLTLYFSLLIHVSRWCFFKVMIMMMSFQPAYISILSSPKYCFSVKLELGQWVYV